MSNAPLRGAAARLMAHLPEPVAANPERILINLGCVLIGLSAIIGQRSPALDRLWPFPLYEWAVTMLIGGLAVLIGVFRSKRTMERLGLILLLAGCLFYAVLLLVVFGWGGAIVSTIFFVIAAAKAVRLVVSSAIRTHNIQVAEEMRDTPPSPPSGGV